MALKFQTPEAEAYLETVRKFAEEHGLRGQLEEELGYLSLYGCHGNDLDQTECVLMKDFAPQSFYFVMYQRSAPGQPYERWFNGGLIFHGPHDGGGNGGAPTFSVSLSGDRKPHWEVHT